MWLIFKPVDPVFFSTGRPFSMGVDSWTEGTFPPNPSTIAGALRTYLIKSRGTVSDFYNRGYEDVGKITTDERGERRFIPGTMRLKGPFLFDEKFETVLFPLPLDLVVSKDSSKTRSVQKGVDIYSLKFVRKPDFLLCSFEKPSYLLWWHGKEQVKDVYGFITNFEMERYLKGEMQIVSIVGINEIFASENKIGIAKDRNANVTREGHLYRISMMRLRENFGFLVEAKNVSIDSDEDILCLGAERKVAQFRQIDVSSKTVYFEGSFSSGEKLFKIYLATPAIFKKGWLPEWIDENTLLGEKDGVKLKLEGCVIGKPIKIGGWDLANEKPKPVYRAVPAGSVYYFRVVGEEVNQDLIFKAFHFNPISDVLGEEGWGLAFVGRVKI